MLIQLAMNDGEKTIHKNMYAWARGKRPYTAALIDLLVTEDAHRRRAPMRKVNLDAMHWYDTVHSCTVVLTERRMGYPKEITYAKAAIRAGNMWIRTERGRAGPVYPEQGLGQGRLVRYVHWRGVQHRVARSHALPQRVAGWAE